MKKEIVDESGNIEFCELDDKVPYLCVDILQFTVIFHSEFDTFSVIDRCLLYTHGYE